MGNLHQMNYKEACKQLDSFVEWSRQERGRIYKEHIDILLPRVEKYWGKNSVYVAKTICD